MSLDPTPAFTGRDQRSGERIVRFIDLVYEIEVRHQ
jgi:hypothetical protein